MKNTRSLILALALSAAVIVSCKQESTENLEAIAPETSSPATEKTTPESLDKKVETQQPVEKEAEPIKQPADAKADAKKFIKTADLKFKSENVAKTTYEIENITARLGGFVAYSNIQSHVGEQETTRVSTDSSVITKRFTVENNMILRVPNNQLHATLEAIAPLVGQLDSRLVKADDATLKILANQMAQNRTAEKIKALENSRKDEANIAAVDNKKEQADNMKLENLAMKDQVSFSTINIAMYQKESVSREMIANIDNDKYAQSFGSRMADSFMNGWYIISSVLVFLANLWPFLLAGIIVLVTLRKYKPALKK